jgi:hypothetical protein
MNAGKALVDTLGGAAKTFTDGLECKARSIAKLYKVNVSIIKLAKTFTDGFSTGVYQSNHLGSLGLQDIHDIVGELDVRGGVLLAVVEHLVSGDGDTPCDKITAGSVFIKSPPHNHRSLLKQVFGISLVGDQRKYKGEDAALSVRGKFQERFRPAAAIGLEIHSEVISHGRPLQRSVARNSSTDKDISAGAILSTAV